MVRGGTSRMLRFEAIHSAGVQLDALNKIVASLLYVPEPEAGDSIVHMEHDCHPNFVANYCFGWELHDSLVQWIFLLNGYGGIQVGSAIDVEDTTHLRSQGKVHH
mmetsp:Transcript_28369/g.58025  ORF Transcript_28369/g.58025 Transcript_28369/m.58025 type:complete len:105 (-) Transcript_28369:257-571(-)